VSDERRLVGPYQPHDEPQLEQPTGPREVLPCSACNGEGTISDMAWNGNETLYECPDCQGFGLLDLESQRPVHLAGLGPASTPPTIERDALIDAYQETWEAFQKPLGEYPRPPFRDVLAERILALLRPASATPPPPAPHIDDPWTSPVSTLTTEPEGTNP
jgi:hypothetical protein